LMRELRQMQRGRRTQPVSAPVRFGAHTTRITVG
jgi:hypothetical protein